jgi:serine/threonine protein kinase
VLFSKKDRAWKLVDFGLTCEVTSKTLQSTEFANGTPGYRAPELLNEEKYTYNDKVDIWAMGCILYELVVGKKLFPSDLTVLEHY